MCTVERVITTGRIVVQSMVDGGLTVRGAAVQK